MGIRTRKIRKPHKYRRACSPQDQYESRVYWVGAYDTYFVGNYPVF